MKLNKFLWLNSFETSLNKRNMTFSNFFNAREKVLCC